MSGQGCPNCGAPYRRTSSTDDALTGEVSLPIEPYAQVCYQTRLTKEKYFGFTLYFHPETLYAVEERTDGPDKDWQQVRLFATESTADDERTKRERVHRDTDYRVRELPLSDGQR